MRIQTFRWVTGVMMTLIGTVILVVPHQLNQMAYSYFILHNELWGALFFSVGILITTSTTFKLPRWLYTLSYLCGASLFGILMVSFMQFTRPLFVSVLAPFCLGCIHTAFSPLNENETQQGGVNLFTLLFSIQTFSIGIVLFIAGDVYSSPTFFVPDNFPRIFGLLFFALSVAAFLQTLLERKNPGKPGNILVVLCALFNSTYLIFIASFGKPSNIWISVSIFGFLSIAYLFFLWLHSVGIKIQRRSFRLRVSLISSIMILTTIVIAVTLFVSTEDDTLTRVFINQQKETTVTNASDLENQFKTIQTTLRVISSRPNLLSMSTIQQIEFLNQYALSSTAQSTYSLYGAEGFLIVSTSPETIYDLSALDFFSHIRARKNGLSALVTLPGGNQPGILISAPIYSRGEQAGFVCATFPVKSILAKFNRPYSNGGWSYYLVDPLNKAYVHDSEQSNDKVVILAESNPYLLQSTDIFSSGEQSGGFIYRAPPDREDIITYSSMTDHGWSVVLEYATSSAYAGIYRTRDMAFAFILLAILFTIGIGMLLSNWLVQPINQLGMAARAIAIGLAPLPLPQSSVDEIDLLSSSFKDMRERLHHRTMEREAALKELENQKMLLEAVVQQAENAILVVDLEGVIQVANRPVLAMMEDLAEDRPFWEHSICSFVDEIGQEIPDEALPLRRAVQDVTVLDQRMRYRGRLGHWVELLVSAAPLKNTRGEMVGAVSLIVDVTRIVAVEQELRVLNEHLEEIVDQRTRELRISEGRLRRLVDSNILGVYYSLENGRIIEANDKFLETIGYSRGDLLEGKIDWNQLTPSEYHQIDQLGIQEANRTGTCTPYEKEYIHKNGHRVPILMGFAALEDTPGEFICFLLDLSPIKMVQMELLEYASRLERSNRELEAFAFVASHDLQEPLRKIQVFGDRLAGNLDHWTEDERNYLTRMLNATRRMRNMIDGMLSLSRVTTQGKPFQRVNMNEVFREVLSDLENLLEREHAVVKVSDLPEIEGDPVQIRQLMQNLIENGVKFHKIGVYPQLTVEVEYPQEQSGMVIFAISDNGIGFDEASSKRIFQPFQRLHPAGLYEGSGIGLATCKKIVERHGGIITATSQVGVGSTFRITLKLT